MPHRDFATTVFVAGSITATASCACSGIQTFPSEATVPSTAPGPTEIRAIVFPVVPFTRATSPSGALAAQTVFGFDASHAGFATGTGTT